MSLPSHLPLILPAEDSRTPDLPGPDPAAWLGLWHGHSKLLFPDDASVESRQAHLATHLRCLPQRVVFGSPASPDLGNNLLVSGSRILGIIAAHPLSEGASRGFFIFLDGRAAAVGIVVRFVASGLVDLRDLLLGVDLRLPSGFEPHM